MKSLNGLLIAMLTIVIGAYLISPVNSSVSAITTPTYDASVASISDLMPLLMVVSIILYVFKGFDGL